MSAIIKTKYGDESVIYHVMLAPPKVKGWAVRRIGARRATKIYKEKEDAIEDAKTRGDVVVVHKESGTVDYRIEN